MRSALLLGTLLGASLVGLGCGGDQTQTVDKKPPVGATKHVSAVKKQLPTADQGAVKQLMAEKLCLTCHTVDGTATINDVPALGPTLKGLFGTTETVVTDGVEREIVVDEAYLVRSLKEPMADITKGRQPVMVVPSPPLTDAQVTTLVDYIKSLK